MRHLRTTELWTGTTTNSVTFLLILRCSIPSSPTKTRSSKTVSPWSKTIIKRLKSVLRQRQKFKMDLGKTNFMVSYKICSEKSSSPKRETFKKFSVIKCTAGQSNNSPVNNLLNTQKSGHSHNKQESLALRWTELESISMTNHLSSISKNLVRDNNECQCYPTSTPHESWQKKPKIKIFFKT